MTPSPPGRRREATPAASTRSTGTTPAREHVGARRLLVQVDADEEDVADREVVDGDVGERLAAVLDRLVHFSVRSAFARFDAQLQPSVAEADEDLVLDRHDGIGAGALVLATRGGPLLIVCGRPRVVAVAAGVDERGSSSGSVAAQGPTKDLDVVDAIADLEHREQLVLGGAEVGEAALAEEPYELVELGAEFRVRQEVARIVVGDGGEARLIGGDVARLVQREDLLRLLDAQFDIDVEAEQEEVADARRCRAAGRRGRSPDGRRR